ncbi:MAG: NAD(P)-dependent oxidoreductase [Candidatus Marinimicrobia bacterium]|nr:NAD(P)-dependent oxidoreductase [Candidatus Neomarinimicrobiota bacterium]
MKSAIVFGGSGFVGRHLVRHLLSQGFYKQILIADLVPPVWDADQVTYIISDVRQPIDPKAFPAEFSGGELAIYNLAALSKIPGFPHEDYFQTNINGAENICAFADEIGCKTLVFTSTMAVYGASEDEKREDSLPQPDNPYGISKLAAEYIHKLWLAGGTDKRLSIVRPGIIYGEDEDANFTRLYRGIKGGYFFYPGRKDTKKASIYVKDVAYLLYRFGENDDTFTLYNLVYPHPHAIEEISRTVAKVIRKRSSFLIIPGWILLTASRLISSIAQLFGKRYSSLNPDRVRKLMVSTNVIGEKLAEDGYRLKYSLEEGLKDWLIETK